MVKIIQLQKRFLFKTNKQLEFNLQDKTCNYYLKRVLFLSGLFKPFKI